jgi:DNA modification methylase
MLPYLNRVFACHALKLLAKLPAESIDSVITDPMYMVAAVKGQSCIYDWGIEPGTGLPHEFWDYHAPIYRECRRVLKPHGVLAWATAFKFHEHFHEWFGGHRIWGFSRALLGSKRSQNAFGHIWIVQTKEQTPIRFPDDDGLLLIGQRGWWRKEHACPKTEEEMKFMVKHLTQPGQIILDVFAGSGTTLVAAEKLHRQWLGCDLSPHYCQVALKRIRQYRKQQARKKHRSDAVLGRISNGPQQPQPRLIMAQG